MIISRILKVNENIKTPIIVKFDTKTGMIIDDREK